MVSDSLTASGSSRNRRPPPDDFYTPLVMTSETVVDAFGDMDLPEEYLFAGMYVIMVSSLVTFQLNSRELLVSLEAEGPAFLGYYGGLAAMPLGVFLMLNKKKR